MAPLGDPKVDPLGDHQVAPLGRSLIGSFRRSSNGFIWAIGNNNRVGHLYQGRYKAFLIDADNYLLEVSRYIHINPIRLKKFEKKPEKERLEALRGFEDSSFAGYCNVRKRDDFINYGTVLAYVGGDNRQGRQACRKFVQEGIGLELENPLEKGKGNGIVDVDDGTSYNPPVKIKVLSGKAMKHSGVSKSIDFWANHSSPELCSGSGKKLDESLTSL